MNSSIKEKSKKLSSGPLELDWTQIDGEVINDLELARVFRSGLENEFRKGLVSVETLTQQK